ncbi:hypothetical protein F0P96_16835 [Hymenobacter busanensis]|uniref:Uncharacterized protein n=1 Tax=Hymenobacter busanensis TaxID=2607656 RepID=A0A7L4ZSG5_9BACT|nr:STAS/SEC14 domain-containing protein [Hymenobacter busanensis]KAA9327642.1 hypothetical protein F0P96_16835 [Hymenobacter busanensis]QHJ06018.1 hypothetical protein GUY19_01395 [Hymenobacter busanensis]
MDVLYDTPQLSISFDPSNDWLYVEWKGNHTAESARTGGELVLQYLRSHPCHKMLNDNSQVTSEWEKGARWVGTEYYQRLAQQQVRHVAWICPPNWGARKSMETAMLFITQPVVVLFDDLASAYFWLKRLQ